MAFNELNQRMLDAGLDKNCPAVIGFSGGPDSAALLNELHALHWPLIIAHLDHGLRLESAADARRAEELARVYKRPFFTERADVAALAEQGGLSIEEAARNVRYEFLFRIAEREGAQAVIVAHNADDQAETVLMHLLRGAGTAGLRGMALRGLPNAWSESIPLVRPLLGISRVEIENYCALHGLTLIIDPSNNDPAYFRNRLRHEVLPALERVAPGIRTRLQHSADLLNADYELIERLAREAWQRALAERGEGYVGLHRGALLAEPLALQRALLRRAAAELRPQQRDVDFAAIERGLAALAQPKPGPQDWVAGLYLLAEQDRFWIADWDAELPATWPQAAMQILNLELPSAVSLNAGWQFSLKETQPNMAAATANTNSYEAWLDADAAGEQLMLRRPRTGDKLQPLGVDGTQSLADLFTNAKLPRRARAAWPLLCAGDQIAWVPGHRLAHPFRLQEKTRRALRASLTRVM